MREPLPILPGAMLGVLGGGQLGRMFALRARTMGYRVAVYDPDPLAPAGPIADRWVTAPWDDHAELEAFALSCAAVTLEFENIPLPTLRYVHAHARLTPSPEAVAVAQDRLAEKALFRELGLPVAAFAPVLQLADAEAAIAVTGLPALLKTARLGYDGKGQARIFSADDLRAAFREFGGVPCILEQRLALDAELSIIVARDDEGRIETYDAGENVHVNGILHTTIVPSELHAALQTRADQIARAIAEALQYVGVLGVECFVAGDEVYVNEIAPRPHNSGHWTMDGASICQFEQQVRTMTGLPLGCPTLVLPTCMVNILGDSWPAEGQPDWPTVLSMPMVRLHLYGKAEPRRGRKMGHLNCTGISTEEALDRAREAYAWIRPPERPTAS